MYIYVNMYVYIYMYIYIYVFVSEYFMDYNGDRWDMVDGHFRLNFRRVNLFLLIHIDI